jgi:hemerythrin-like domain-containing protein
MTQADVRRVVLQQHEELRAIAGALSEAAERVIGGDPESLGALRERGFELHGRLIDHLEYEDQLLLPAVRASGEVGVRRVEQLVAEHAEQRALLDYVLGRLEDLSRPSVILGRELLNFSELLLVDMDYEETTVLALLSVGD